MKKELFLISKETCMVVLEMDSVPHSIVVVYTYYRYYWN